jgi:hypothetical protein
MMIAVHLILIIPVFCLNVPVLVVDILMFALLATTKEMLMRE